MLKICDVSPDAFFQNQKLIAQSLFFHQKVIIIKLKMQNLEKLQELFSVKEEND